MKTLNDAYLTGFFNGMFCGLYSLMSFLIPLFICSRLAPYLTIGQLCIVFIGGVFLFISSGLLAIYLKNK